MTGTEEETPGAPGVLTAVVGETSVGAEETGTTGTEEEPGMTGTEEEPGMTGTEEETGTTGTEDETPGIPGVLVPMGAVVGKTSVGAEETGTTTLLEMTGTTGELEETTPVTMVVPVVEVIATLGREMVAGGV